MEWGWGGLWLNDAMCKLGILVENANNAAVRSFTGEVMTAHCNCAFALLFCYYHILLRFAIVLLPHCYMLCYSIMFHWLSGRSDDSSLQLCGDAHWRQPPSTTHCWTHVYCVWSCWVCLQCNTTWCLMLVQCNAKQWCSMHLPMRCQRSSVAGYRWPSPPPPTAAITILFFLLCCYYYFFCYSFTIILAAITMLL